MAEDIIGPVGSDVFRLERISNWNARDETEEYVDDFVKFNFIAASSLEENDIEYEGLLGLSKKTSTEY